MTARYVNILYPLDRIFRIGFVINRHSYQGHQRDFVMQLRGRLQGFYGNVAMSAAEMRQMRSAIDGVLYAHEQTQDKVGEQDAKD